MTALLELRGVERRYRTGDDVVHALRDVSLTIEAGELVAIMGQSGSGKSTLMHILGCLDRPDAGDYRVAGEPTAAMAPDELARLRREHFGFVFQRYQLLDDLTALRNVEMPAIYAGATAEDRHGRALALLQRLGLADRVDHRPSQLSGGQQQRVSIARALMNGGQVILADEPTGALDTASGEDVLTVLQELHRQGHTVVIVTHDLQVASHAHRIVELRDGRVVSDRRTRDALPSMMESVDDARAMPGRSTRATNWYGHVAEAALMAVRNTANHRLRTLLTTLGIVIGVASVVCVTALGEGSRREVLAQIRTLGTNVIEVQSGRGFGDQRAGAMKPLTIGDVRALEQLAYVDAVSPVVSTTMTMRRGNVERSANVRGIGARQFHVRGFVMAEGSVFDEKAIRTQTQDAIVDENVRKAFFADVDSPLGQVLLVGTVPVRVVGVVRRPKSPFFGNDTLNVYLPYTTAMARLTGIGAFSSIVMRIKDDVPTDVAEAGIKRLMLQRHGLTDFFLTNTEAFRESVSRSQDSLTLLVASIAVISLVVGGVGVMNIMLVTVTERTQEIGIRMAVGARRVDILRQFLIEAVLVCLLGGVIGIALALAIAAVFDFVAGTSKMPVSGIAVVAAVAVSSVIGIVFGFAPARKASRLDPIEALSGA